MSEENKILVSCITPSVRSEALEMVFRCLKKQTFPRGRWEWIVGSKFPYDKADKWVKDPGKNKGDFYSLNKTWNNLFREANGRLIVDVADGIWFPPDTLSLFWYHYENNPKACITAVGHQYEKLQNNQPEILIWEDPRARTDLGSFYQVNYSEMEFCLVSLPKQAILDCKGTKNEWDKYAALSEKEMCARIEKFGYSLWIEQSLQYKAIHHERLNGKEKWDEAYFKGCKYMDYCMEQINQGKELLGDL